MANPVIHLFNGFLNPNGGRELEALDSRGTLAPRAQFYPGHNMALETA
jgi:hypothetical protein